MLSASPPAEEWTQQRLLQSVASRGQAARWRALGRPRGRASLWSMVNQSVEGTAHGGGLINPAFCPPVRWPPGRDPSLSHRQP